MKTHHPRHITLILSLVLTLASYARADAIKLFLLAGQSNMVGKGNAADLPESQRAPQPDIRFACRIITGDHPLHGSWGEGWTTLRPGTGSLPKHAVAFGPEIGFGRAIADAFPKAHIAIVKFARNGANLYDMFNPSATTGLQLYPRMIAFTQEQIRSLQDAGHDVQIAGFLWYQGEADAAATEPHADAYADNLNLLIAHVRKDLGAPNLPVVAVRVNPDLARHVHADTIRAAIQHVTEADPHAAWVNIDDLHLPDHLHLDAPGQLKVGQRLAAACQKLASTSHPSSNPTTLP